MVRVTACTVKDRKYQLWKIITVPTADDVRLVRHMKNDELDAGMKT